MITAKEWALEAARKAGEVRKTMLFASYSNLACSIVTGSLAVITLFKGTEQLAMYIFIPLWLFICFQSFKGFLKLRRSAKEKFDQWMIARQKFLDKGL